MQWRYEDYDPSKVARKELLRRLKALYMELLLQADGDPEQALEWLAQLARRYRLFPAGLHARRPEAGPEARAARRGRPPGARADGGGGTRASSGQPGADLLEPGPRCRRGPPCRLRGRRAGAATGDTRLHLRGPGGPARRRGQRPQRAAPRPYPATPRGCRSRKMTWRCTRPSTCRALRQCSCSTSATR
jgi:hypothetical protein